MAAVPNLLVALAQGQDEELKPRTQGPWLSPFCCLGSTLHIGAAGWASCSTCSGLVLGAQVGRCGPRGPGVGEEPD